MAFTWVRNTYDCHLHSLNNESNSYLILVQWTLFNIVNCTVVVFNSFYLLFFLFSIGGPIERLDSLNVITVKFKTIFIWCVEGRHYRASNIWVSKAKGVTKFMRGCHKKIGSSIKVIRPILITWVYIFKDSGRGGVEN